MSWKGARKKDGREGAERRVGGGGGGYSEDGRAGLILARLNSTTARGRQPGGLPLMIHSLMTSIPNGKLHKDIKFHIGGRRYR